MPLAKVGQKFFKWPLIVCIINLQTSTFKVGLLYSTKRHHGDCPKDCQAVRFCQRWRWVWMFEFSEGVYKVVAFCRRRYTKYDFVSLFI